GRSRREAVDDRLHVGFGFIAQFVERAKAGLVRGQRVGRQPLAVGELEEVIARLHCRIAVRKVDAERAEMRLGSFGYGRRRLGRAARGDEGYRGQPGEKKLAHMSVPEWLLGKSNGRSTP